MSSLLLPQRRLLLTQHAAVRGPGRPPFAFRASAVNGGSGGGPSTIAIPGTAQPGDFALLFDYNRSNGSAAAVTPSVQGNDFTILSNNLGPVATFSSRGMVSGKILIAGDPGSNITGMNGGVRNDKVLLIFSGGWTSFGSASLNGECTDGNPTSQSVTASGGAAPLIVYGCAAYANGFGAFSTATPAFDGTVAGDIACLAGYKIYASSPANHSIDMNDLGNGNWLASGYITLS